MVELIKDAFAVLKEWPLVQGAVAILVLVIASLLAFSAVKRQPPAPEKQHQMPAAIPVQIESPWLVQHLLEIHLDVVDIKNAIQAIKAKQETNAAGIAAIISLLRRRANRKDKKGTS